ncbi:hypothetical protein BCR41DRAFT_59185 [Lobosporangium transversale]|uniref:Uncharacterized protein n=1 Tax=Lobosporangium transversale TaxID=64571 RepID=A0A1Y2GS18_9FUNG|nr:hypothetical protein BCR41DRAFT_59185 [Lobosporangium transversale]ORZ16033.1 hypothetical protein BCR41DRAFT_59185 [Lobosporangium transversale]|eukprot:XP_021881380.1 hypothetical protein BCR41DRAFT_59185 [Lobosporangium transversale]
MLHEQKLYAPPEHETKQKTKNGPLQQTSDAITTTTATGTNSGVDESINKISNDHAGPWQHLFPSGPGPDGYDEFISATQSQLQTQQGSLGSQIQLAQMLPSLLPEIIEEAEDEGIEGEEGRAESRSQPMSISGSSLEYKTNTVNLDDDDSKDDDKDDNNSDNNANVNEEPFRADLWSRIQIRYVPTLAHLQSFFRCIHLDPEDTQDKTFGYHHQHKWVTDKGISPTLDEDEDHHHRQERVKRWEKHNDNRNDDKNNYNNNNSNDNHFNSGSGETIEPSIPTLIILIGCFSGHFYKSVNPEGQTRVATSSLCALPSPYNYRGELTEIPTVGTAATAHSAQQQQPQPETFQTFPSAISMTSHTNDEDRERVQYIKMANQALSEIKDSLEWIQRASGQNPELLIFEENRISSPASINNPPANPQPLPSERELWLQQIVGFWTDCFIVAEVQDPALEVEQQQHPSTGYYSQELPNRGDTAISDKVATIKSKDCMRLWIKTRQSIRAILSNGIEGIIERLRDLDETPKASAPAASSIGAIVGLDWEIDQTATRCRFQLLT